MPWSMLASSHTPKWPTWPPKPMPFGSCEKPTPHHCGHSTVGRNTHMSALAPRAHKQPGCSQHRPPSPPSPAHPHTDLNVTVDAAGWEHAGLGKQPEDGRRVVTCGKGHAQTIGSHVEPERLALHTLLLTVKVTLLGPRLVCDASKQRPALVPVRVDDW
jgi:hypothetical protein